MVIKYETNQFGLVKSGLGQGLSPEKLIGQVLVASF